MKNIRLYKHQQKFQPFHLMYTKKYMMGVFQPYEFTIYKLNGRSIGFSFDFNLPSNFSKMIKLASFLPIFKIWKFQRATDHEMALENFNAKH